MFADDTKLYKNYKHDDDDAEIQRNISELQDWSTKWCLKFHPDKCKQMIFSRPSQNIALPSRYMLNQNGHRVQISRIEREKDLGVIFDSKLQSSITLKILQTKLQGPWVSYGAPFLT